uniref:Uncharacterized protein n=1 Tax=Anopheles christyi TaxID=43041 RepID=A0A182KHY5_9DIPT
MDSKNSRLAGSSYKRSSPSLITNPWRHKVRVTTSRFCELDDAAVRDPRGATSW